MEDFSNCDTFKKDEDPNLPKLFCIGLKPGKEAPPQGQFGAFIQNANERSEIQDSSDMMETNTFSGFKGNRFSDQSSRLRGVPNHRRSKPYEKTATYTLEELLVMNESIMN